MANCIEKSYTVEHVFPSGKTWITLLNTSNRVEATVFYARIVAQNEVHVRMVEHRVIGQYNPYEEETNNDRT